MKFLSDRFSETLNIRKEHEISISFSRNHHTGIKIVKKQYSASISSAILLYVIPVPNNLPFTGPRTGIVFYAYTMNLNVTNVETIVFQSKY